MGASSTAAMGAALDGAMVFCIRGLGFVTSVFLHINGNYLVYTNIMPDGVVLSLFVLMLGCNSNLRGPTKDQQDGDTHQPDMEV